MSRNQEEKNSNENSPQGNPIDKVLPHLAAEDARLDTTLALESEPFVAFEQWIDSELDKLVSRRWLPFAAPNAQLRANIFGRERMK